MSAAFSSRLRSAHANRCRIARELGAGGIARLRSLDIHLGPVASVYLCDDIKHDRKVALKLLKPELADGVGDSALIAVDNMRLMVVGAVPGTTLVLYTRGLSSASLDLWAIDVVSKRAAQLLTNVSGARGVGQVSLIARSRLAPNANGRTIVVADSRHRAPVPFYPEFIA